jgi:hypothetical protein
MRWVSQNCEPAYYYRARTMGSILALALGTRPAAPALAALVDLPIALDLAFEEVRTWAEADGLVEIFDRIASLPNITNEEIEQTKTLGLAAHAAAHLLMAVAASGDDLPEPLRHEWSGLWQKHLHLHNIQQRNQHTSATEVMTPLTCRSSLRHVITTYLSDHSHTNAVTLAVLSAFPRGSHINLEWMSAQYATARLFEPLLRLAQDTRIQLDERINAGIYYHACQSGISPATAAKDLLRHPSAKKLIEAKLQWEFWRRNIEVLIRGTFRDILSSMSLPTKLRTVRLLLALHAISSFLSAYVYSTRIKDA